MMPPGPNQIPHIRPMCEGDLDDICAIEADTFPDPWTREALAFELKQNPFCSCFVTEFFGRVAGYAFVWVVYEQSHLINIAFSREMRGKGLGETLLLHVMRHAAMNGAELMHLEVRENNDAAVALYIKHGFTVRGRKDKYYNDGTPALLMETTLSLDPEAG